MYHLINVFYIRIFKNYEYFNYIQNYQEICLYLMIILGRKKAVKYMILFEKIYLNYVLSKN